MSRYEAGQMQQWLDDFRWDRTFFSHEVAESERSDDYWVRQVNGYKVLDAAFSAFGGPGVYYDKVKYGPRLRSWLADNVPTELEEVAGLIASVLDGGTSA